MDYFKFLFYGIIMKYVFVVFLILLAACSSVEKKPRTQGELTLGLNPEVNYDIDPPLTYDFNDTYTLYSESADRNHGWIGFTHMIYSSKYQGTYDRKKAVMVENGVRDDVAEYYSNKEVWELMHCEVQYMKSIADDPDLKTISESVLTDVESGGNYSSYWKTFKSAETQWFERDRLGEIIPLDGKEDVAKRFLAIIDTLQDCQSHITEYIAIVRR